MSISLTLNGSSYIIPTPGELGWGSNLDAFFVAIPAGCLQKTGGSFTLTAETNFGTGFGLKTAYLKSQSSNIASTGILRLANGDNISWRDNLNTIDIPLSVNSSNQLTFNGNPVGGTLPTLLANRAVITNGTGGLTVSTTTNTEISYLSGVTGPIQTQLNNKLNLSGGTLLLSNGTNLAPALAFSGDLDTGIYNAGADKIGFAVNGAEVFQIGDTTNYTWLPLLPISAVDLGGASNKWSSVWGSTAYFGGLTASRVIGGGIAAPVQIETAVTDTAKLSITQNCTNLSGPILGFVKTRGSVVGSNTLVVIGDELGTICWYAADGTDTQSAAASIACQVGGNPGANDTPGNLVFNTTPDGSASPLTRMTILADGRIGINSSAALSSTNGGVDIWSGGLGLIIGADNNAITRTDATTKNGQMGSAHYTNSEEPAALLLMGSGVTSNVLSIGGGSSAMNTATELRLYTAANNTTLTGSVQMTIDSTGAVTQPSQPSFLAKTIGSPDSNATGDNSLYIIQYGTEVFDQGNNYSGSTYTFTASVTGKYLFTASCLLENIDSSHTGVSRLALNTTVATYNLDYHDHVYASAPNGMLFLGGSLIVPMTAGDTAYVVVQVNGGTKTINVRGAEPNYTNFSGSLIN